jgi:hypothetical protein
MRYLRCKFLSLNLRPGQQHFEILVHAVLRSLGMLQYLICDTTHWRPRDSQCHE